MISLEKLKILTPLQKLPKNVGDLGKLIVAKCFETCPKSNKLPNLVTLCKCEFLGQHYIILINFYLSNLVFTSYEGT